MKAMRKSRTETLRPGEGLIENREEEWIWKK